MINNQPLGSIEVEIKTVYGNEAIYPLCPRAKKLAEIANTKTLTRQTIRCIREMGFSVAVVTHGARVFGLL